MEVYREEKRKDKRFAYQSKKKINEQLGRKVFWKLFWKEESNAKGEKVESCSKIKDRNGRLAQGEDEVGNIWKEYFEDLYNINTQEQVIVHMCGFDEIQRGYYFEGEPIGRGEIG